MKPLPQDEPDAEATMLRHRPIQAGDTQPVLHALFLAREGTGEAGSSRRNALAPAPRG
jgi:hypothetical protein